MLILLLLLLRRQEQFRGLSPLRLPLPLGYCCLTLLLPQRLLDNDAALLHGDDNDTNRLLPLLHLTINAPLQSDMLLLTVDMMVFLPLILLLFHRLDNMNDCHP